MVCSKFNSHLYKLKRCNKGEYICFYFATRGLKRPFHQGVLQGAKKLRWANEHVDLSKRKKKRKLSSHPLTN
jgi:hypothetical protein